MDNPGNDLPVTGSHREVVTHLLAILQTIRFGSIEIVVHDGRVVQIDKHEKFRVKTGHNKQ